MLANADEIIGHNIVVFDLSNQLVYPDFSCDGVKVTDTLVLSRLIRANLKEMILCRLHLRTDAKAPVAHTV